MRIEFSFYSNIQWILHSSTARMFHYSAVGASEMMMSSALYPEMRYWEISKEMSSLYFGLAVSCLFKPRVPECDTQPTPLDRCELYSVHFTLNTASNSEAVFTDAMFVILDPWFQNTTFVSWFPSRLRPYSEWGMITIKWSLSNDPGFLRWNFPYSWTIYSRGGIHRGKVWDQWSRT
jgi:hypothetical protein